MLVLLAAKISKLPAGRSDQNPASRRARETLVSRSEVSDEFYARYREPAIALLAATAVFPNEEITHRLAAKLIGGISPEGHLDVHERHQLVPDRPDANTSAAAKAERLRAKVTVKQNGKIIDNVHDRSGQLPDVRADAQEFLKNPAVTLRPTPTRRCCINLR